jgi:hypothetical protein
MRRDRAAALRIDPLGLAGPISIHLPQQSFFSRKHCHFADPLIGTGVWENVFSYLRERLQDIRQLA